MAFAQGSQSELAYVVESSFGGTPSSPAMKSLPFSSHTLNLNKATLEGDDIQSDRMTRFFRHGNKNAVGDINVALRTDDFDDLLESAFFNTFGTSGSASITPGTTEQFLTIEDRLTDITKFRQFTGMSVSQLRVQIQPNDLVRATFSMVGEDMTTANSTLGSPSAASGNDPFDSYSGTIKEGGSTVAIITGIDFTLNNSQAPIFVLGSQAAQDLESGRAVVTGTVTALYEDNALVDKFVNETGSSLEVTVNNTTSAGSMTFLFPNVVYNGADAPVQNPQSRIITLPFAAIYDSGESANIKLTRN